ncbi:MAG: Sulfide dehydrogenase subunit beta precursor [Methanomassiliicoccales archaeon PtaB.Bin134]|jgi:ferredoxin--NADP+ reductase|nr:MAG: Sulfide dehydrogenase subunit beta precursor [Methanomassiliicoccales archaeon PtaB.Bin134]
MYRIISKERLAHKHTLFEVEAPEIAAKALPGQFLIVVPREGGERVPLSICDYDRQRGTVSFAFHEVGKTTRELGTFEQGQDIFNVTGPLGNPSEIGRFGRVLCVGGSIMAAPALLQAKALKEAGNEVVTVLGCRSQEFLFKRDVAERYSDRVYVSSDDGSVGEKGLDFLKDLLSRERFDRCTVIGPVVMMKRVSEITKPFGIPTVVSLTPIMIDGMGMCGVCRVTVGEQMLFGCVDGPEFDGHKTNFDELINRQRSMLPEERLSALLHEHKGGCRCGRQ